ncbi:MAG: glycosyltransferase family 2 protein [Candidatus Omnitrophica bacterium]|nr:glycosyltransferase family 2 protein [Candidatus Omnitrophota bacterium]MBU4303657.1 glycosyltransferase family 2 protein [Candidatus Omnitrophota bacterium]MBU4467973.1 glycosyltransferase family 2 protein [Candidatus Omnitrophota bacterium]MCG2707651.1 glycosyltransferase family 2 protein [Candidatus Omnitrophota bacterium]
MKLSIVIPVYNEEESIGQVIEHIESQIKLIFELIVVNDYSSDRTAEIVAGLANKFNNIVLVENKFTPGFANAVKTGLMSAKNEVVVPVMGDLCDDLGTIPFMFEKVTEGFDVVCGARYIKGGARMGGSKIKGFFSFFVGRTMSMFTGIPTRDVSNAFKMYRKEVIESINIESAGFEVSMELALKAYFNGFKITEVPTVWREREKGKSSFKMFNLTPNYFRWYLWAIGKKLKGV